MDDAVLVGDIGGTNARFALASRASAAYTEEKVYVCRDFATPEDAIREYLSAANSKVPAQIILAVAGPINQGTVSFTNNDWHLNAEHLQSNLRSTKVQLLNDFEAVAYCLPELVSNDRLQIGLLDCNTLGTDYQVAVLGPGTGLGVATLTCTNGQRHASATEGGHIGFAAESEEQLRLLTQLQSKFGRVSAERCVSGQGIENLYWALSDTPDAAQAPSAADIFEFTNRDPIAQQAVALFFRLLGQVAGDIALATGAFDGIYLAGGIAQRYAEQLAKSDFRAGFESKGRHTKLMQSIPTTLITHPQPGLLGATSAANF